MKPHSIHGKLVLINPKASSLDTLLLCPQLAPLAARVSLLFGLPEGNIYAYTTFPLSN